MLSLSSVNVRDLVCGVTLVFERLDTVLDLVLDGRQLLIRACRAHRSHHLVLFLSQHLPQLLELHLLVKRLVSEPVANFLELVKLLLQLLVLALHRRVVLGVVVVLFEALDSALELCDVSLFGL